MALRREFLLENFPLNYFCSEVFLTCGKAYLDAPESGKLRFLCLILILISFFLTDSSSTTPKKRPRVSISLDLQEEDQLESRDDRDRSPSPPMNDVSVYLMIINLVRPFTNNQLKALISKTGTIEENGFWINSIKSHCYVKVCLGLSLLKLIFSLVSTFFTIILDSCLVESHSCNLLHYFKKSSRKTLNYILK